MTYDVLESCMLIPGFSRGECASWVQAWGSVAAVLIAVWISNRQARHATDLELGRLRVAKIERLKIVLTVLAHAQAVLRLLKRSLDERGAAATADSDMDFLRDNVERLKALPPFEIPDAGLVARVTLLPRTFAMLHEALAPGRDEAILQYRSETEKASPQAAAYGYLQPPGTEARDLLAARMSDALSGIDGAIQECRSALDRAGWYEHGARLTAPE